MLQKAEVQGEEQYLKITGRENGYSLINVLEKSGHDLSADLINDTFIQEVAPFYYNTRIRLAFRVREEFKSDFILIRGLIEFHRPKDLLFSYNIKQFSIDTDIDGKQLYELQSFISKVFVWLKREKQFKLALKIALEFENRYRLESESVYQIMKNAAAFQANNYSLANSVSM